MTLKAIQAAHLDRLYFIPTNRNPHKAAFPQASPEHRLAMLRLAIAGNEHLNIWESEITAPPPSYTIHTVTLFKNHFPKAELFWLIGADNLAQLHRWKAIETLVQQVTFLVLPRSGQPTTPSQPIPNLRLLSLDTPIIDVCATNIREALIPHQSIEMALAPAVYAYIQQNKLYE